MRNVSLRVNASEHPRVYRRTPIDTGSRLRASRKQVTPWGFESPPSHIPRLRGACRPRFRARDPSIHGRIGQGKPRAFTVRRSRFFF